MSKPEYDRSNYINCNSALGTLQGELKTANAKIKELESLFSVQLDMHDRIVLLERKLAKCIEALESHANRETNLTLIGKALETK